MSLSLRIGSDTLGWQECGHLVELGTMTRNMPGGDGSLEFTLPGEDAERRRNVLVRDAEVHLDLGDDSWHGFIVGEPLAGFVRAKPLVEVACAGMWDRAAKRRDIGAVWADSDPTRWFRFRKRYDATETDLWVDFPDQGKFTVDTEGRLFIRADSDRTYAAYSRASLGYWLNQGLVDCGWRILGVDLTYKNTAPGTAPNNWRVTLRSYLGTPWECATSGTMELSDNSAHSSWTTRQLDLTQESTSLVLNLNWNNSGSGTGWANDPYVNVKSVTVWCGKSGTSVNRSPRIDTAMCDLATLSGLATATESATLGSAQDNLALPFEDERSIADGIRELASMHNVAVEYWFDHTGGAWTFHVREAPTSVDVTRNRHWVLDDRRGGEDSSGVVRDYEAAPEYLRIAYLSSGVAGIPDGTARTYCYPSEPPDFAHGVTVITDHSDTVMTDAEAAATTARIAQQQAATSFSGEALFGETVTTVDGLELPSYRIRPGDRLTILGREGAENLYIQTTSYDFTNATATATIGWPFDVLPRRRAMGIETGRPTSFEEWVAVRPWLHK